MLSSRFAIAIATLTASALTLAACSPQPTPSPDATPLVIQPTIFGPPTPEPTAGPTSPPEPTSTPIPPKPIVVPVPDGVDTLHPFYAASPAARDVLGALFVGCVGQDDAQQLLALGCEQVPTQENGGASFSGEGADRALRVTFTIRPGWRWTDGQPVTAQDAVYAWQLSMSPESGLRDPMAQQVYSMSAPDERTIVVQFMSAAQAQAAAEGTLRGDVPFEYFSQLGDYAAFAARETPLAPRDYWSVVRWLPAHLLRDVPPAQQRDSAFAQKPVGDGAYEIASADDTRIVLRPAAKPFATGAVANEGLTFQFNGALPAEDAPAVVQAGVASAPDVSALDTISYTSAIEMLVLNTDRFPFDDVVVRQALAHAINRESLGQNLAATSAVQSSLAFDPAQSRSLLTGAGWVCEATPCTKAITDTTTGEVVTRTLAFKLTTTEREPRNVVSQALQKQLSEAGFGVDVEIVFGLGRQSRLFAPFDQGGTLLTRNFDAALYQVASPQSAFGQFACASIPTAEAHEASKGNASGFCDPEIDPLLIEAESGESVISQQGRTTGPKVAMQRVEQAAPVVMLYEVKRPVYVRGVTGLKPATFLPITWNAWAWGKQ